MLEQQSNQGMNKKEIIQMIVVMALMVGGIFVAQHFFFSDDTTSDNHQTKANEPANAPKDNTASEPTSKPDTKPDPEPDILPERGFDVIAKREQADHWSLANDRLTATFSERGGVLETIEYVDRDGNVVYYRTPDDPVKEPYEALKILQPMDVSRKLSPLALQLDEKDSVRNISRWKMTDKKVSDGKSTIEFRFPPTGTQADGTVIKKRVTLYDDSFRFDVHVTVENHGKQTQTVRAGLWGAVGITNDARSNAGEHARVALYGSTESRSYTDLFDSPAIQTVLSEINDVNEDRADEGQEVLNPMPAKILDDEDGEDRFLIAHGLKTQYFFAVLLADPDEPSTGWQGDVQALGQTGVSAAVSMKAPEVEVAANASESKKFIFYVGPRDKDVLEEAWMVAPPSNEELPVVWRDLAYSGFPGFISSPMIWILSHFSKWFGAGLAVIILTLLVRFGLSPLSYRGQKSMATYTQKMKVVKPKLDAIKAKYKDRKDRDTQMKMLNETRAAMKEQNVGMFPLGGCLPMLVQFPIFIGLYRVFGNAFFLRQESFLWIHDLTLPDATLPMSYQADLGFLSGFLGYNGYLTLNLLPILWIFLSIAQMRMQPKSDDPQQQAIQKQMGCIFPLMGLFFYSYAAGFSLYFIFSSIYSLCESRLIKHNLRKKGILPPHEKKKDKDEDKPEYVGAAD